MTYSEASTQSNEDRTLTGGSSAPTRNSRGELVWNPAVGIYHKPAAHEAESYGGVIGALEDAITKSQGSSNKDYPENFAGIIAAIQDLAIGENTPGSNTGDKPPGTEIIVGPDGRPDYIVIVPPQDGELWFDTRQGRLFVAVDQQWYQTNGADGLAFVQTTAPQKNVVQGQFWWDRDADGGKGNLFIFTGQFTNTEGTVFSEDPDDIEDAIPVWELVAGADQGFQDTNTLPLANTGPKSYVLPYLNNHPTSNLPDADLNSFTVQADYNGWLFESLAALDKAVLEGSVSIGLEPPTDNLVNGTLWYDTESLELSIYYIEDDGTAAWVPTSTPYAFDDSLAVVTAAVQTEARTREYQFHQLQEALNSVNTAQDVDISGLEADIAALQQTVATLPIPSIDGLVGKEYVDNIHNLLETSISQIEIPSISGLASETYVNEALAPLVIAEATHATKEELAAVRAEIPSLNEYATTGDVSQAIATFNNTFLPRNGGFLTSGLSWNSPYNARNALSFATYSPSLDVDSTFGTTDNYYELAWNFESNEDYCWVHSTNGKVFSVTKDGPACEELLLGEFSTNDENGRVMSNTIGVKAKLEQYQLAFQSIVAAAHSATTFDDFKGHLINTLSGY